MAAALGRAGVSTLLVVSQVVLSIVLPFIVFPLLLLTSNKELMTIKIPRPHDTASEAEVKVEDAESDKGVPSLPQSEIHADLEATEETVCYANSMLVQVLGWILWVIVVAANVYAIVSLGLGTAST